MSAYNIRLEVMKSLEHKVGDFIDKFLTPVDNIWQPSDLLPDSGSDSFFEDLEILRGESKELPYDFWIVLIGDTITEEALPTYESWLMDVVGINQRGDRGTEDNPWAKWIRAWSAEENRHGDVLSKYLYLSGRVNMKEVEISTQYLIADGFDIGTDRDPYKNFVYTSFQELATNISHVRVGKLALERGNKLLAKMNKMVAGDEMRHYLAYREFVNEIFKVDPSEMMLAFENMMRKKIVMPAHLLKVTDAKVGEIFEHFSDIAQRLNVYTTHDYIDIMKKLINYWAIDKVSGLNEAGEKARDYLMTLPDRLTRIAERVSIPDTPYKFAWVEANGVM